VAHDVSPEDFATAIRSAGGRVTASKRAVIAALLSGMEHPSADDLAHLAREWEPEIGLSTVYRILDEFDSLGLIAHSHFGGSAVIYHIAGRPHGHLTCEGCGRAVEIAADAFRELVQVAVTNYDFFIDEQHLALSGRCGSCRGAVGADTPHSAHAKVGSKKRVP
jgi:Fur family transcriptional regulator, ferric uptake regulator